MSNNRTAHHEEFASRFIGKAAKLVGNHEDAGVIGFVDRMEIDNDRVVFIVKAGNLEFIVKNKSEWKILDDEDVILESEFIRI